MPEFTNLKDAFQWWIENEYHRLPPAEKENIRFFKYNFKKGKPISKDKMLEILEKYMNVEYNIKIERK